MLDQIAVNGQAKFYVILTVQADLSGAAALPTKLAKTTYVLNLLRETARQTQQPLTQYLDRQGLDYRAYYIANMIEVTGGRSAVEWLAARPDVARISSPPDPHPEPVTRSPQHRGVVEEQHVAGVEWNITRVRAPDVWAMGFQRRRGWSSATTTPASTTPIRRWSTSTGATWAAAALTTTTTGGMPSGSSSVPG